MLMLRHDRDRHRSRRAVLYRPRRPPGRQGRTIAVRRVAIDCGECALARPRRCETFASEGERPERRTSGIQHQMQRLPADRRYQLYSGRGGDSLLRHACRIRQDRRGDYLMDATLVVIDSAAELARDNALVEKLMTSERSADT